MFVLICLHYYWYVLFIKMILFYKKHGKAEDLQNKTKKKIQ